MSDRRKGIWKRASESDGVSLTLAIVGALGLPLSLFAWFGVTPESIGTMAYDLTRTCLPAIVAVLSFISGWNAKKLFASRRAAAGVLKGDNAISFISNLPDNLKRILLAMHAAGGSVECDPLDGDMRTLSSYSLVMPPDMFTPGIPVKWSLTPNAIILIREHPEALKVDEYPDDGKVDDQIL